MEPRAPIVDRLVAAIEGGDAALFASLYAEDAVLHEPVLAEPSRGRDAIMRGEQVLLQGFSDISVHVQSVLHSEQSVAVEVLLTATHTGPLDLGDDQELAATYRTIELPMAWFLDVGGDGLIRSERDYFDTGSLMAQLGVAD